MLMDRWLKNVKRLAYIAVGVAGIASNSFGSVVLFDNIGSSAAPNYSGQGVTQGPVTTSPPITRVFMSKLTFINGSAGQDITNFSFSVFNANTHAVSVRARVRFWNADGTGDRPGTYYNPGGVGAIGYTFDPFAFNSGLTILTASVVPGFKVPSNGSSIWAGVTYDVAGTATSAAELSNMGQGLFFSPAQVGSVGNEVFETTNAGSFFGTNNPAGSFVDRNVDGRDTAYGWKFEAVPEPSTLAALGLGALALLRRKKTV
jgi:hypothetical protein